MQRSNSGYEKDSGKDLKTHGLHVQHEKDMLSWVLLSMNILDILPRSLVSFSSPDALGCLSLCMSAGLTSCVTGGREREEREDDVWTRMTDMR